MPLPAPPDPSRFDDPAPHARWLSNGRYTVLATSAGTGRSTWDGFALTPFRGDRVEDGDGLFAYLRDVETGAVASLAHQPLGSTRIRRSVEVRTGVVALAMEWDDIEARIEIAVAPDADVELRRVVLSERAGRARTLELTTAAEVVLDRPAAFASHPAFSKLFVQTEWDAAREALVARRRPRAPGDRVAWLAHALLGPGALERETDRARFIGRGGSLARPASLSTPLGGTLGNVLDPVFALRRRLTLAPGGRIELAIALAAGDDRDALGRALDRAARSDFFDAAAAHERALLARLGLSEPVGAYLDELLGALVYGHPALRAPAEIVRRARGALAMLWSDGIGGEHPLVVASLAGESDLAFARELAVARAYWGEKAVEVDLLLVTSGGVGESARALAEQAGAARGGRVVVWRREEVAAERIDVAHAWAAGVVGAAWPSLASAPSRAVELRCIPAQVSHLEPLLEERLLFFNGWGGFSEDGSYVLRLHGDDRPPMPWIQCLANPSFGSLVGESGAAHTWSRNSHEHRLTPWSNDPVCDPHGEALWLRDAEGGVFWSPTPGPTPDGAPYEVRHELGATLWRHTSRELEQEVTCFVPPRDPLKVTRVRLRNRAAHPRRISITSYQRLVLGGIAEESGRSVVTARDGELLLATNGLAAEFADGVTFAAVLAPRGATASATGDRAAFLGRSGSPRAPRALACDVALDGRTGAGLDPCFAWQVTVEIPAQGEIECAFLFGETASAADAQARVDALRADGAVARAQDETRAFWRELAGGVQIETPLREIDLLVNGWLAAQTAACRLWGRTAFYQSGGAFGFRDQLQDATALVHLDPALSRAQILLHAAHQFVEGDVLHWWHPPAGKGTRTHFSDDLLWLPHLTGFYVGHTGDASVLDEVVGFRRARLLEPGEDEAYLETEVADESASVYEHCCRALDRSLTKGAHGLPLMGTGDWNDGMNRVGREGRGESVWVGFFLYATLPDWIAFAEARGEHERAASYRSYREHLRGALDGAWDGAWYRRAYYDDGTPLGSASSDECQIDALAQSWAVISGAAPPARAAAAMDALEAHLVSREDGLIRLLTPPFDKTSHEPGYIKGYLPGIRENGGQYTHGALWAVKACAELGRRDRAAAWLQMLTGVWHATRERVATYQVEPYVMAADIYGEPPHVGRGGWTWYTGSAGWTLRVAVESVLGVTIAGGDTIRLRPCVPDDWPRFAVRLRMPDGRTHVAIEVENPARCSEAVVAATLDGVACGVEAGAARMRIPLDGAVHRVAATLGALRS